MDSGICSTKVCLVSSLASTQKLETQQSKIPMGTLENLSVISPRRLIKAAFFSTVL